MNKKGLIGRLVSSFVLIGITLMMVPIIAQQVTLALDCNSTAVNQTLVNATTDITDSFSGGGAHFGGYDGEIKHDDFMHQVASASIVKTNLHKVASASIVKTNQSALNPGCENIEGPARTLLGLTTFFFALSIVGIGLATVYSALRDVGCA